MVIDEVENLEAESKKESYSPKVPVMSYLAHDVSSVHKNVDETLTTSILSQALPNSRTLTVTHYDFPF